MFKTNKLIFMKKLLRYNSSKIKLSLPPKMPDSWECCGDGCPHCVWITYFEDLETYNQTIKKNKK